MRSLAETRSRWDKTFAGRNSLSEFRDAVRQGTDESPCVTGLRSVCWKVFLLFESLDQTTWLRTIQDSRGAYVSLKEHFLKGIDHADDISATDPLADDNNSPWNTLRQDETLRAEIFQDVQRCMPENLYFREPTTESFMTDILFIFCRLNPDIGYRQGMHEVLAPILWVMSRDAIDTKAAISREEGGTPTEADQLPQMCLDMNYIEHDSFTLFCILMQTAKSFYELGGNSSQTSLATSNSSAIVERSRRIHEVYLRRTDPELTEHLISIDILPQIFVIRWIRLLFGREFPFNTLLLFWDTLFADDPRLNLVDYICVAMLLRVRWQLLDADYSSALTLLLRYPVPSAPNGPVTLVQDAFYLRENLSVKGGKHIVLKYSGRSPTDSAGLGGPTSQRRSMHPSQYNSDELDRAKSPLRSPSQFLLEWGGIEGIFQEAVLAPAKGVYKQSEKWGLNQALRAVQGLQSGTNSPRRSTSNARWSLDEGKHVPSSIDQFQSQLKTLEHRNKTIAKMLNKVTGEFLERAKRLEDDSNEDISGWISIIGAKLQFIHVYLNDSTLPLDATGSSEAGEEGTDSGLSTTNHPGRMHKRSLRERRADTSAVTPDRSSLVRGDLDGNEDPEQQEPPSETGRAPNTNSGQNTAATTAQETSQPLVIKDPPENDNKATASNTTSSKTDETTPRNSIERPGHRQQRASLSQSSFAWMLAENKQGSSVEPSASSPLSPRKDRKGRPKGKTGYLFGEEGDDDAS